MCCKMYYGSRPPEISRTPSRRDVLLSIKKSCSKTIQKTLTLFYRYGTSATRSEIIAVLQSMMTALDGGKCFLTFSFLFSYAVKPPHNPQNHFARTFII